jgi:outer membrane protein assembly factor BamB
VVWTHRVHPGPRTGGVHDPRLLDSGTILIFDNHWKRIPPRAGAAGVGTGWQSRVLEIDPADGSIVWEYRGSESHPFYSKCCGTAQRLPNGNTLITESEGGRAFEVDPQGRIVWEFYNPERGGDSDEYIATLFGMVRLPPDFPVSWARGRP